MQRRTRIQLEQSAIMSTASRFRCGFAPDVCRHGRCLDLRHAPKKRQFDDAQTYAVIGAAMEVHRVLGCGFLEAVYRAALAQEFELRGVNFRSEMSISIQYKQRTLPLGYRADFICFGEVLVEAKALGGLGPIEEAQLLNYLKGSGLKRGLLLNFGTTSLQYRRMVRTLDAGDDPLAKARMIQRHEFTVPSIPRRLTNLVNLPNLSNPRPL